MVFPKVLRTDNGPEFLSHEFVERFNRTYSNEVLDLDLFNDIDEVRGKTYWWMIEYNEERSHDSLDDLTPVEYMMKNVRKLYF